MEPFQPKTGGFPTQNGGLSENRALLTQNGALLTQNGGLSENRAFLTQNGA